MANEDTTVIEDNQQGVQETEQVNTDPGWMSAVSKETREAYGEDMRQYANINPILTDYYSLKEKADSSIQLLGENATEEEVANYNEKMGIPTDASEYELDTAPKELDPEGNVEKWFRETAKGASLNKTQAKAVYEAYNKLQEDGLTAINEKTAADKVETERLLRAEYGSAYEGAMANSARILDIAGEGFRSWLNESGAGNDPRLIRTLARVGAMISEDSIGKTQATAKGTARTQAEIMYPTKQE
ncbi:MAG: hypothetical protein DRP09_12625 [Candidatus Thorarchaeota archaeon]|nr:MAG: hypothetical protein DRP09_12625 [Candidatus Thorarchaeota archaeon]